MRRPPCGKIEQEALLWQTDRAMRCVSQNRVNCCIRDKNPLDGPNRKVHDETKSADFVGDPRGHSGLCPTQVSDCVWLLTCPFNLDMYGLFPWVWSGP